MPPLAGIRLERFTETDGFAGYRSPSLSELGVAHVFTTRHVGDGAADARALEARLFAQLDEAGAPEISTVRQVHGADVHVAQETATKDRVEADAIVLERPGQAAAIRTADCVPILLASACGEHVAAIHAGWRGLIAGVIQCTANRLGKRAAVAAVGASLSIDHFEVGSEVAAAFVEADLGAAVVAPGRRFETGVSTRPHVDLRLAVDLVLRRAGISRIDHSDRCTWRDETDFFSYRRDVTHGGAPTTGRMLAVIATAASRAR